MSFLDHGAELFATELSVAIGIESVENLIGVGRPVSVWSGTAFSAFCSLSASTTLLHLLTGGRPFFATQLAIFIAVKFFEDIAPKFCCRPQFV